MTAQHGRSASPFSMLYFAPVLLVLVIQATFIFTPALAQPPIVPSNIALVPLSDVEQLPRMYIEVHPCAGSFIAEQSLWYKAHGQTLNFESCSKITSASAWRTIDSSGKVECIPIWRETKPESDATADKKVRPVGDCFIFHGLKLEETNGLRDLKWAHPCEKLRVVKFSSTVSIWYTAWHQMPFDDCQKKPNAGAWQGSPCIVLPNPHLHRIPGGQSGTCFVLDKVPTGLSYVEVHPCDKFFFAKRSKFFTHTSKAHAQVPMVNLEECSKQTDAVAWTPVTLSETAYKCVPMPSPMTEAQQKLETGEGLCYRFNTTELPRSNMGTVSTGAYLHPCAKGFESKKSKWYSLLENNVEIQQCSKHPDAVAWRTKDRVTCFVLYPGRKDMFADKPRWVGGCYVRNKVVALYSSLPPWLGHPIGHDHHGVNMVSRDGAGLELEAGQSSETYTYMHPFGDVGYPYDVAGRR